MPTIPFRTALVAFAASTFQAAAATNISCDTSALNTTKYLYPLTTYPFTSEDGRGLCDIGRANLMADISIVPNIGQTIVIPGETCEPDNETCLLPNSTLTNDCVMGGPRLYYTVNGDTYNIIARRLNITAQALMGTTNDTAAAELLTVAQFVKVPLCSPSSCVMMPISFTQGVYRDLAALYSTTVGQIMMLSPTYNYSTSLYTGAGEPSIDVPVNCTLLSDTITVLS
jgi:hypothetical protein